MHVLMLAAECSRDAESPVNLNVTFYDIRNLTDNDKITTMPRY